MREKTSNPYFDQPYALKRWKRGPLGRYVDGFARHLFSCGYSPSVGQDYVRSIGHMSLWMEQQRSEAHELDEHRISDYLQYLKHQADTVLSSSPYLLFLSYLKELRVIKEPSPAVMSEVDQVVNEYVEYLRSERGLAESTLHHPRLFVRRFLEERFEKGPVRLADLNVRDFVTYIQNHAHQYCAIYWSNTVARLKDFCRFLQLQGHVKEDIASGIPETPHWKTTRAPGHLERSEVERLLSSCDRQSLKGMRDYAILLLLVKLGLRAVEVRNLTLDDIDWQSSQIVTRGKGGKRNRLPLPQAVGEAIVQYLQHGRPPCSSRSVFIRMRAPHTGMQTAGAIGRIVKSALERAGLNPSRPGSHILRHTFATRLVQQGASLPEVGRMLGHEHPDSTRVYTHINQDELTPCVRPWPGGEK